MKRFRNEVFDLCKTISVMDQFENLRKTLSSLSFTHSESKFNPKADVCYNGIRLRAEFYGLLLAFQKHLSSFPNVDPDSISLTESEYTNLTYGHLYISKFIELCLDDISSRNSAIGKILSPYSFFYPINEIPAGNIDLSIFENAVKSFKDSSVYRYIMESNALEAFSKIPEDRIRDLFGLLYRDIIQSPPDAISDEIVSLKAREKNFKPNQQVNPIDALQLISFKLVALREMLSAATSLIYDAILGNDLTIINEENLISIKNNSSNAICSYKTILIQGDIMRPYNDSLNTIFLLNIDNGKAVIHDFGRAYSSTISFGNENGTTTKLSFCVLDEELNPISNLTNN